MEVKFLCAFCREPCGVLAGNITVSHSWPLPTRQLCSGSGKPAIKRVSNKTKTEVDNERCLENLNALLKEARGLNTPIQDAALLLIGKDAAQQAIQLLTAHAQRVLNVAEIVSQNHEIEFSFMSQTFYHVNPETEDKLDPPRWAEPASWNSWVSSGSGCYDGDDDD